MSNVLAAAAVTATLNSLLIQARDPLWAGDSALSDLEVSLKPLDVARTSEDHSQLNLFLYQVLPNAAWRNHDMPPRQPATEGGPPPLALNLFYLLTAYGRQNDELHANRLLITAMRILHDNTVIMPSSIVAAAGNNDLLFGQDLDKQVERIHITPQPLSIDEMSKVWGMFQGKYRSTVAYQVSAVLVESRRTNRLVKAVETRSIAVNQIPEKPIAR